MPAPSTAHASTSSSARRAFLTPDLIGVGGSIDWIQLCFSVWKHPVWWHQGWGQAIVLWDDSTAVHRLSQMILYFYLGVCGFLKNCPQIRKNHKRLCPSEEGNLDT
jgi:hypothetical protein